MLSLKMHLAVILKRLCSFLLGAHVLLLYLSVCLLTVHNKWRLGAAGALPRTFLFFPPLFLSVLNHSQRRPLPHQPCCVSAAGGEQNAILKCCLFSFFFSGVGFPFEDEYICLIASIQAIYQLSLQKKML